jgi:GH43 family beta-xylosidase
MIAFVSSQKALSLILLLHFAAFSQTLFTDDFSMGISEEWNDWGGTWSTSDGVALGESGAGFKLVTSRVFTDFVFEADIRTLDSGEAGVVFRVTHPAEGADAFSGYYAGINTRTQTAVIGKMNNDWTLIASRNIPVTQGIWYHLKVIASDAEIRFYVNDYQVATGSQYPKFDVADDDFASGAVGFRTFNIAAQFDNVKVTPYTPAGGPTYTNQLLANAADPHVLFHEGVFYLYCTASDNGIPVYSSTDLVHWKSHPSFALRKEDSWGDRWFWAPDVIERGGRFYMAYAVDEHLAIATADSPLGPFVQAVQAPMHTDIKEIDGHFFVDEDGKVYFYFVRFTNGNEIWGAELNDDLLSIKENTLTHMLGVSQEWERDQGKVNEGPFILKHQGLYYLTYSANHFESPAYGIGYATSNSPLGPWTKYAYNPILQSNTLVHGAGHHSITISPNHSEMFLVYHTHNSLTQVSPRRLGIDRLQFIEQEGGPDVLEAWGPTITPQAMPATGNTTPVLRRARMSPIADGPSEKKRIGSSAQYERPGIRKPGILLSPDQRLYNADGKRLKSKTPVASDGEATPVK